ncbi:hypothetical protein [Actinoplanes xinjiangensis]|jgi:hypothetical protein|uniref:Uncharacterized protein n=1 Tax=Actinoplanes xinjiangensis TaxID=512350 RepID=A0A316FML6_9ACTN|nr:hypothetical protein [Actinoplanes xinjiangensis]PWK49513.1 hypothetical protein BC793_104186 [Actinoplanes xinjiangensis]GIF37519.1 hypothetical protein Axi01nite_18300 [Actinoplanes xinjiangensis]
MTGSGVQGWHVTLFVTAAITLIATIEWLINAPPWKRPSLTGHGLDPRQARGYVMTKRLRAALLVLLALVAVVIVPVGMLGPTLADQLAGVTAVPLGGITLILAYLSYRESREMSALLRNSADRPPP